MVQSKQPWQYKIVDGKHVINSEITVHRFAVAWHDDATLLAAEQLHNWEISESGSWVMEHAVEKPRWIKQEMLSSMNIQFAVIARLTEEDQTYYRLKFT